MGFSFDSSVVQKKCFKILYAAKNISVFQYDLFDLHPSCATALYIVKSFFSNAADLL